jgi:hypothetical protein
VAKFLSRVDASGGPDACHPWQGSTNWSGYPVFRAGRRQTTATRFALELKLGRLLGRDEDTRHSQQCVTRRCCNEAHLTPGTRLENIHDTITAGRAGRRAKTFLTSEVAAEVRRRYASGEHAILLAGALGISLNQLYGVVSGRRWNDGNLPRVTRPRQYAKRGTAPLVQWPTGTEVSQ